MHFFSSYPLKFDPIMLIYIIYKKRATKKGIAHMKNVNYTPEMTAQIVSDYEAGVSVDAIAETINKSVRSVRSKLVREGVYVAKPKTTTRKADEPTKKELLNQLEDVYPFDVNDFMGATKMASNDLLSHFSDA